MNYLGDFAEDATVDFKWSTNDAAGASITRGTNGTVSVYIGNSTTQVTAGVTDTEDFDSVTGVHHCRIDLSADAAYAVGSECQVVLSGSTIDGEAVNAVLAHFSIERAGGALALLKGATNGLAAIKNKTNDIETDTQDIQSRLPAALVSGRMDSSTGEMAADVITSTALATSAVTEIQSGLATSAALATVDTVVDAIQAKTDNLPSDPADQSLIVAATTAIYDRIGAPAGASVSADIAAVKSDSAAILDDTGSAGVVVAAASKTGYRLSSTGVDDILDEPVEAGATLRQSQRLHNAVLGGKASGLETTAATFRDLGDTKDVVVATVDGDGNRSAVTHDLT